MPNRRQVIIWINTDLIHWRIYMAVGGNELISQENAYENAVCEMAAILTWPQSVTLITRKVGSTARDQYHVSIDDLAPFVHHLIQMNQGFYLPSIFVHITVYACNWLCIACHETGLLSESVKRMYSYIMWNLCSWPLVTDEFSQWLPY